MGNNGPSFSQANANAGAWWAPPSVDKQDQRRKRFRQKHMDATRTSANQPSSVPVQTGRVQRNGRSRSPVNRDNGKYRDRKNQPPVQETAGYAQRRCETQQGNAPVSASPKFSVEHDRPERQGRTASEQQPVPEHQPARTWPSSEKQKPAVNRDDKSYESSQMSEAFGGDSSRYLAKASAARRSYQNPSLNKRRPPCDPTSPNMVYSTTLSGIRRGTGRPRNSPTGSTSCSDSDSRAAQPPTVTRIEKRRKATPKSQKSNHTQL